MKKQDILNLDSMPAISPSYPKGPYRFIDREYFIIIYKSSPEKIREIVPEPLEPDGSNEIFFEFIKMPDSFGFGDYVESGVVIPCMFNGERVNFTSQMYLDCHPPIVGGREIWGFPKKLGTPTLEIEHDTLIGTLKYGKERVAMGSMKYKHRDLLGGEDNSNLTLNEMLAKVATTQVNLKLIPCVAGGLAIAQLVAYNQTDTSIKGAWLGDARLDLMSHVNAPVADLPVHSTEYALHLVVDTTLPYGRVIYDYHKQN